MVAIRTDPDDADLVAAADACPKCGERHADRLVWLDDQRVRCASCDTSSTSLPAEQEATMVLERIETFSIDRAGDLVRSVSPKRGRPYQHTCTLASFQAVSHAAEEIGDAGFVLEDLVAKADVPFTQAAVALAFLKERGCVVTERKRNYPVGPGLHADGMIEYHAQRELPAL